MQKIIKLLVSICIPLICFSLSSCGSTSKDDLEQNTNANSIVGKWADGDETLTFGKDGSYREDGYLGQYRIGTYSYSPSTSLLVVNVKAVPGMNSAYQQTYIVQTLSSSTLVLIYTDGDVKGYYSRQ